MKTPTAPAVPSAHHHWVELATTVLLAAAAVATAWASYQAARWHGKQAEAQSASIAARVESTRASNVADREAEIDVEIFIQWVDAYAQGQAELADFYRSRFRDEFKPAFAAWIATKPLQNEAAPLSPFALPLYRLAATVEADRLEAEATAASEEVKRYIQRADNYTLTVVLFATSLFFAGISTRLRDRSSRITVLGIGYVLFVGAAIWIATFPVTIAL
jgi:hypothetical protein